MSWFRAFILLAFCAISACGFTPVYGPGGSGAKLINQVEVDPPRDREGFLLVRRLEERLGRASTPNYRLAVDISQNQETRAVGRDGNIRRYHIVGAANYTLFDKASGAQLQSGRVESFVAYSASRSSVATLSAQRDSVARLMTILADRIVTELEAGPVDP